MHMKAYSLLVVIAIAASIAIADDDVCDLYLAPSLVPGVGRGVIAGRPIPKGVVVDVATSLTINKDVIQGWQLNNYVYDTNEEGYSMALIGPGMIYNHKNPHTLSHVWNAYAPIPVKDQTRAHSTFTKVEFATKWDVEEGEEIFASYGDHEWFTARDINLIDNSSSIGQEECQLADLGSEEASACRGPKATLADLKKNGHCLTDVYVAQSSLASAGEGLFARRAFQKGEIVTISPLLLLPKESVVAASRERHCVLQNYCIASPTVESTVLFPIGLGSMANHRKEEEANLQLQWHFWSGDEESKKKLDPETSLRSLRGRPFAPLDLAYVAKRDIAANEELTLFYGSNWVEEWAGYLGKLVDWMEVEVDNVTHGSSVDAEGNAQVVEIFDDNVPVFRSFIEAPEGFFPLHWSTEHEHGHEQDEEGGLLAGESV